MLELFADYDVEGFTVPVDREEFLERAKRQIVQDCTVEERLEGLTAGQRLIGVTPEQLTPQDRETLRRLLDSLPPG